MERVFLERISKLADPAPPHLPAVQLSALLHCTCGTGQITHLLRTSPPRITRTAARRFDVVSTGWFELGRQPRAWLPQYAWKKVRRAAHWQVGRTALLSHPGCLLSRARAPESILPAILRQIENQRLTVLVTHWWEYFEHDEPVPTFVDVLHETAAYLAKTPNLKVISFGELAQGWVPLT